MRDTHTSKAWYSFDTVFKFYYFEKKRIDILHFLSL